LLILRLAQAQCIGSFFCSFSSERDYRSSGQNRPQIDLHFIDQLFVKRLTKNFATAFDQHARDAAFT
jgi:hypothetical protein